MKRLFLVVFSLILFSTIVEAQVVQLPHVTTPTAIRTGSNYIYAKSDGELYTLKPNGTEVKIITTTNIPDTNVQWPVGSIYTSIDATNPATLFGFGVWARFGEGKILISQISSDGDFDTVEETGGDKTHTLTVGELPSHNHTQDAHNHTQNAHTHGITTGTPDTVSVSRPARVITLNPDSSYQTESATATNQAATATNQATGGGSSFNIMNPYIVVYMWKRIS